MADRQQMTTNDLSDRISALTAAQWRELLAAAAMHRCIRCGECDGCECSDEEDDAVAIVLGATDRSDGR